MKSVIVSFVTDIGSTVFVTSLTVDSFKKLHCKKKKRKKKILLSFGDLIAH